MYTMIVSIGICLYIMLSHQLINKFFDIDWNPQKCYTHKIRIIWLARMKPEKKNNSKAQSNCKHWTVYFSFDRMTYIDIHWHLNEILDLGGKQRNCSVFVMNSQKNCKNSQKLKLYKVSKFKLVLSPVARLFLHVNCCTEHKCHFSFYSESIGVK